MTPALLLLATTLAAPQPKDPPNKVDRSLVGTWAVERVIDQGKDGPAPPGLTWTFTADGKYVINAWDVVVTGSTYVADSKSPAPSLDMAAGAVGKPFRGIWYVEGDYLTFCFVEGDQDRPTAFESQARSKVVLVTLKRVKKE